MTDTDTPVANPPTRPVLDDRAALRVPTADEPAASGTVEAIATAAPAAASDDDVVVPRFQPARHRRRRRRRSGGRPRLLQRRSVDLILRYGVLAAVLLAPLMVGGVHFVTGVALGALGVLLGALALAAHGQRALRSGAVAGALGLWLVATALQLVPLPIGLVDVLAPAVAEHYRGAYALLGEAPGFVPLSLSPNQTALALWQALGFCGVFTAAWLHFRQREHFAWLVPRLTFVGALFVLISVAQTLGFDGSILGVYQPQSPLVQTPLATTLINPNHAAAFFGALAPLALGCALASRDVGQRYTCIFVYLVLSVAMFMMLSRGAILAWALCHPVFFFLLRSASLGSRLKAGALGMALCLAVTAGVFAGYRQLEGTFESMVDGALALEDSLQQSNAALDAQAARDGDAEENVLHARVEPSSREPDTVEKVIIYRDLAPLFATYAATGIGRDAFGEVYPPHATHGVQRTFRHVENEYLEFAIEYGVFVALAFFGLLAIGLVGLLSRTDWRDAERPLVAGVLTAIVFLAVHNLFDFNLRFPGVGFLLAALLGAVVGRGARYAEVARERDARSDRAEDGDADTRVSLWQRLQPVSAVVLLAGGVAALLVATLHLGAARRGSDGADLEAVRVAVDGMAEEGTTREALLETARSALLAHPVDGYLRLLVGIGMLRSGEGGLDAALPWLDLALRLNPSDSRGHLLIGRVHAARGDHGAAAAAFATSATLDRRPSLEVARSAAALLPDAPTLIASLSHDPADWAVLGAELVAAKRFDVALEVADHLRAEHPEHAEGLDLSVQVYLELGLPEAAGVLADELVQRFPDEPSVFLRRAQVALALGDVRAANAIVARGIEAHERDLTLLFTRIELLLYKSRDTFEDPAQWDLALEQSLEQVRPVALSRKGYRPRYHYLRAERLRLTGHPRQALRAYEEAARLNPRWVAPLIGSLDVALQLGDTDTARASLTALAPHMPPDYVQRQRQRIEARQVEVEREMLESPVYMGRRGAPLSEGSRKKLGLDPEHLTDPLSRTVDTLVIDPDRSDTEAAEHE